MSLISVEIGPFGYLILVALAGSLFFWLRRWLRTRLHSSAAVVSVAVVLAFGLTLLLWLLLLLPNLLSQRALK